MNLLRKLVALVAVLAVLYAALAPASPGLLLAIVVPVLLLIGLLTVAPADGRSESPSLPVSKFFGVLASRAPPCC